MISPEVSIVVIIIIGMLIYGVIDAHYSDIKLQKIYSRGDWISVKEAMPPLQKDFDWVSEWVTVELKNGKQVDASYSFYDLCWKGGGTWNLKDVERWKFKRVYSKT